MLFCFSSFSSWLVACTGEIWPWYVVGDCDCLVMGRFHLPSWLQKIPHPVFPALHSSMASSFVWLPWVWTFVKLSIYPHWILCLCLCPRLWCLYWLGRSVGCIRSSQQSCNSIQAKLIHRRCRCSLLGALDDDHYLQVVLWHRSLVICPSMLSVQNARSSVDVVCHCLE